eukprot:3869214-Rhodomonas_salina.1
MNVCSGGRRWLLLSGVGYPGVSFVLMGRIERIVGFKTSFFTIKSALAQQSGVKSAQSHNVASNLKLTLSCLLSGTNLPTWQYELVELTVA